MAWAIFLPGSFFMSARQTLLLPAVFRHGEAQIVPPVEKQAGSCYNIRKTMDIIKEV